MQLVLAMLFFFVLVGVIPKTFDARQQSVIAVVAVGLAMAQFAFARFL